MRIKSGICIELNHDHSIFLIKNGQFVLGTPASNSSIGEEVSFYPLEKKRLLHWNPVMAPVLAAAAVFILFMSALLFPEEEAFSYVQVEINPGIELGIDDRYEVVSIRDLNSDGGELIDQLDDWENDSLFDVLNRVFELAVTEQTKQIVITSVGEDSSESEQSIEKVVLAVSSIVESDKVAIQMKEATREQWRQSKKNLIPVGQMIEKAETLKVQRNSEVQEPVRETDEMPAPKERKSIDNQETPSERETENKSTEKNDNAKTNMQNENKPAEKKKQITPAVKEKVVLPAAEKKKNDPSLKKEQQHKTPKQKDKRDESLSKTKNTAPVKTKDKEKPTNRELKEKPVEKKKQKPLHNKEQKNSEAAKQQKKKEASTGSNPAVKKEIKTPPGQQKKKQQADDAPVKKKEQKKAGNFPKKEREKEDKKKE
ncbi:hypothetical protein A1A1_15268 [Planococcus antarcticus DSM 14505]|uniref:RsgI N-terminal anti-sigma domain-containing protein n=1 Tax=Planococcus antarcticus DSM 14505 TaxID=1185653 RepID=A0A1C7DG11_9BACL|nr:hypothetical protein [Planococcus antarcticus]ANU10384.1 hypothetical protein BBH88_08750 [Planococcus antarcticus DSM 14505]EIM05600.1 hypothetical protein A1A1_15268 [Planococcus antarcticus DSM 14505]